MNLKGPVIVAAIAFLMIIILIITSIFWVIGSYNDLVEREEDVDGSWAQVENEYQRKVDLIPDLIKMVEDYKEFENSTIIEVTDLRTRWAEADSPEDQMKVASELDQVIKSIVLTYESYPELDSVLLVHDLMVDLEGAENRITVERMRYNEDVKGYNKEIKKFPKMIVANSFGFDEREYFESGVAPDNP